jgi:hypothetical protein
MMEEENRPDFSKKGPNPNLEELPYGRSGLNVMVTKPQKVMNTITITQDLSGRSKTIDHEVDSLQQDSMSLENQPKQVRRCGETGTYLQEQHNIRR